MRPANGRTAVLRGAGSLLAWRCRRGDSAMRPQPGRSVPVQSRIIPDQCVDPCQTGTGSVCPAPTGVVGKVGKAGSIIVSSIVLGPGRHGGSQPSTCMAAWGRRIHCTRRARPKAVPKPPKLLKNKEKLMCARRTVRISVRAGRQGVRFSERVAGLKAALAPVRAPVCDARGMARPAHAAASHARQVTQALSTGWVGQLSRNNSSGIGRPIT